MFGSFSGLFLPMAVMSMSESFSEAFVLVVVVLLAFSGVFLLVVVASFVICNLYAVKDLLEYAASTLLIIDQHTYHIELAACLRYGRRR